MTSYRGMHSQTGQALNDDGHIAQSIQRILITPIGSRLIHRTFGSQIPDLIDQPLNSKTRMQVMAASVMALASWEPRIELTKIQLIMGSGQEAGQLTLDLEASNRETGQRGQYGVAVR